MATFIKDIMNNYSFRKVNYMNREDFISMCYSSLIKHSAMQDVAYYATNVDENSDVFKLQGYWINIVAKPQYVIGPEAINIKKVDATNWEPYYETKD